MYHKLNIPSGYFRGTHHRYMMPILKVCEAPCICLSGSYNGDQVTSMLEALIKYQADEGMVEALFVSSLLTLFL